MLIDNGDLLQGSPMGDYVAYERGMKDGDIHPIMKGMNVLGYECSTFGNHEFNYGLDFFDKVIAGANFPFVCANLDPRHDARLEPARRQALRQAVPDPRQNREGWRRH